MSIKSINAETLKDWMASGDAVLVDVREQGEHVAEKIEGAHLVPLGTVSTSALPTCEGKKLVLHCRSGKRSGEACKKLLAENPDLEIFQLEGGISAWRAAGQGTISSGTFFLPLDQQVQLTLGVVLVVASLLGAVFSPTWFWLTGLVGTGLMVAGLTGFCGLAKIMAKMPWNQGGGPGPSCAR